MESYGIEKLGIHGAKAVYRNLTPAELTEAAVRREEGFLSSSGAGSTGETLGEQAGTGDFRSSTRMSADISDSELQSWLGQ